MTKEQINAHNTAGTITDRQAQILHLRRQGFSQYAIARGLNVTRSTVRSLERTALDKIEASQAKELAA